MVLNVLVEMIFGYQDRHLLEMAAILASQEKAHPKEILKLILL